MENKDFKELGVSIPLTYQQIIEIGGVKQLTHIGSKKQILLLCGYCNNTFKKSKDYMYTSFKGKPPKSGHFFCSKECNAKYHFGENCIKKEIVCEQCGKIFYKKNKDIKKTNHSFCSRQCSGIYYNTHKKYGTRVSKLEKYIQQKLIELYPQIFFSFNDVKTINTELDIYIPSLNLAFELNGIFHYEPIYGENKLEKIQKGDSNKFQKCIENNISLCIIDTSQQKYFKENTSKKYLDIIVKIINENIG